MGQLPVREGVSKKLQPLFGRVAEKKNFSLKKPEKTLFSRHFHPKCEEVSDVLDVPGDINE